MQETGEVEGNSKVPNGKSQSTRKRKRTEGVTLLSEDQKRFNHVSSEQRRRQAMREAYDQLVDAVPDLTLEERRSELMIYAKTTRYLRWLYAQNKALRHECSRLQTRDSSLTGYSIPRKLIWDIGKNEGNDLGEDRTHDLAINSRTP
ncbi:LAMI_0B06084g1_1 [Lachancea mirantina]|uniref:LAMI_0B06084g1_1 n=1 Tax=Lachancea mirantina TaxID=1230905 RepID=A0A1G4IWP2_9SACH|nr:LAMI_0B06084g1_1 [Lachancea mirantina]